MSLKESRKQEILAREDAQKKIKEANNSYKKQLEELNKKENEAMMSVPQDTATLEQIKEAKDKIRAEKDSSVQQINQELDEVVNGQRDTRYNIYKEGMESVTNPVKGAIGDTTKDMRLSDSFYRDFGAALQHKPTGNLKDVQADTAAAKAQSYANEAANRNKEAQKSQQIADRNEYSEAGKVASMKDDAVNRKNIQNKQGLSGSAAALMRNASEPDVQAERARQDEQRNVANERRAEADIANMQNINETGWANQYKIGSRDANQDTNTSTRLSLGEGGTETDTTDSSTTTEEDTNPQTPEDTTPEDDPASYNTDWQNVLNYITFGADQTSGWSKDQKDGGNARKFAEAHGWKPVTMSQAQWDAKGANAEGIRQQIVAQQSPDFYKAWQEGSKRFDAKGRQTNVGDNGATIQGFHDQSKIEGYANGTNCAEPGLHWVGERGPELVNFNGGEQVVPNEFLQSMRRELSDMRMKWIKEDYDKYGSPTSKDDLIFLLMNAGKFKHGDKEYDYNSDEGYDNNDIVKAYGDHIRNYVYTYKPEATQVDSSIDPNEEHIGPMAQDIEQVNPACVKETSDGVKTVDTARLAMMNAGAIGDLARQMQDIVNKLKALGV